MAVDDPLEQEGIPKWIVAIACLMAVIVVIGIVYAKNTPEKDAPDIAFVDEEFSSSAPSTNSLLTPTPDTVRQSRRNPFSKEDVPTIDVTEKILQRYKGAPKEEVPTIDVTEKIVQRHKGATEEVTGTEPKPATTPVQGSSRDDWFNNKKRGSPPQKTQQASAQIFSSSIRHESAPIQTPGEMSVANGITRPRDQELQDALIGSLGTPGTSNTIGSLLDSYKTAAKAIPTGPRGNMLSRGKTIPCVLETSVQTDLPGLTRCITTRSVYSDNGTRLLLPRGTVATGEYQGGLRRGVNRIFVVWTRLRTPEGVIIELAAPSVGPLGASGIHAKLNSHFWTRFGSSMLLSVIGGLSATQDNNEGSPYGGSAQILNQTAELALEESIGIKTTGSVPIGKLINIMVAEDVAFDLEAHNGH